MCHSVLLLREHENVLLYDVIFTIYVISRIYAFKNRKFPQHTINIFDFRFSLSLYLIDRLQFITSFSCLINILTETQQRATKRKED